jgi:hypothetical protein
MAFANWTYEREPDRFVLRDPAGRFIAELITESDDDKIVAALQALHMRPHQPGPHDDRPLVN